MHPLYNDFTSYLDAEDKERSVQFVLSHLRDKSIDVLALYNEILTPAMYADFCTEAERETCIWKEHIRTSIVRTIIECAYPFIIEERERKYGPISKGKAVIVCPPEELHELGARMVADFFTLVGFSVTFVGANTPQDDIINAIKHVNPDYVVVSETRDYNFDKIQHAINLVLKGARLIGTNPDVSGPVESGIAPARTLL